MAGLSDLSVYPVREHYIVYVRIGKNRIVIVALIRQTRDVPAILKANSFKIRRQMEEIFDKFERGTLPDLAR